MKPNMQILYITTQNLKMLWNVFWDSFTQLHFTITIIIAGFMLIWIHIEYINLIVLGRGPEACDTT